MYHISNLTIGIGTYAWDSFVSFIVKGDLVCVCIPLSAIHWKLETERRASAQQLSGQWITDYGVVSRLRLSGALCYFTDFKGIDGFAIDNIRNVHYYTTRKAFRTFKFLFTHNMLETETHEWIGRLPHDHLVICSSFEIALSCFLLYHYANDDALCIGMDSTTKTCSSNTSQ